jgi:predicted enzyme related to lactoylglutathione lyase
MSDKSAGRTAKWNLAPYFIVDDVVATANFYRDKLGFSYERFWGEPPCFVMVRRNGICIMLKQLQSSGFMHPNHTPDKDDFVWDTYIWVDQVESLYDQFKKAGVQIVRPMCDMEYNMREFDILDCNGYRLCFGQDVSHR